jgi:uncharacterized protein (TIGR02231 family)
MPRIHTHHVAALVLLTACSTTKPPNPPASPAALSLQPSRAIGTAKVQAEPGVVSRIDKVTVYSDRALVTRSAKVKVHSTASEFRFTKLPGWIDEDSVRASVSVGKITDVSVRRRFLARSSDAGYLAAEAKHKQLLRRIQAFDDELTILAKQQSHVGSIKIFSLEKLSKDSTTRDIKIRSYGDVIDFVSDAMRRTAKSRRAVKAAREKLIPQVAASQRNLNELKRLTKLEETTVTVTVQAARPAAGELVIHYATPGATWQPMHEVRASKAKPDRVTLTSFAVVTQTTGEDWNHAKLSFSTQSVSDSKRIPELKMLALGKTVRHSRHITHRSTSFSRAQTKYHAQNRHWNRRNQASLSNLSELQHFEKTYTNNLAYFERVQSKTVELFQGLKERGTTAHFSATEPAVVRSDGRASRLPIGSNALRATRQLLAAPEQSLNAAETLNMVNRSAQPLLPGAMARYRDGAFLGMTRLDFVAKGEPFSAFFRVADHVKLRRTLDRKHSSLVRRATTRMKLSFLTSAQNLSNKPVKLALAERIPVSENSAIRLSGLRVTPRIKPDAKGIVRWSITLQPGERREFRTAYVLDYPPSLIIDARRRLRKRPRRGRKLKLSEQLERYEQML